MDSVKTRIALQALFAQRVLNARGCPIALGEAEYLFARPRRWRFDWAWPDERIAIEVEGGVFVRGRHTRGAGYVADMEKYNEARVRGWAVYRITPSQLAGGHVVMWVCRHVLGDENVKGQHEQRGTHSATRQRGVTENGGDVAASAVRARHRTRSE